METLLKTVEQFQLRAQIMVISTLRLMPSPKQRSEVLEILRSVVGPAESQPGCLGCHIYAEDGPDPATVLCGEWDTESALQEHIRSEFYLRVLAACELSNQPPEFCFHHVRKTQGMELICELRGHGNEKNKQEAFVQRKPLYSPDEIKPEEKAR